MGASSDYDSQKLQERVAKLSGGDAVTTVGVATEIEMEEKKSGVEAAPHATCAAVEERVVARGGVVLVRAISQITCLEGNNKAPTVGVAHNGRSASPILRQCG